MIVDTLIARIVWLLVGMTLLVIVALLLNGCAISEAIDLRQQAITSCRDLGFIGAIKDAGAWYCYGPRLGSPGFTPKVR